MSEEQFYRTRYTQLAKELERALVELKALRRWTWLLLGLLAFAAFLIGGLLTTRCTHF